MSNKMRHLCTNFLMWRQQRPQDGDDGNNNIKDDIHADIAVEDDVHADVAGEDDVHADVAGMVGAPMG